MGHLTNCSDSLLFSRYGMTPRTHGTSLGMASKRPRLLMVSHYDKLCTCGRAQELMPTVSCAGKPWFGGWGMETKEVVSRSPCGASSGLLRIASIAMYAPMECPGEMQGPSAAHPQPRLTNTSVLRSTRKNDDHSNSFARYSDY